MFLTAPTINELEGLELQALLDMLVRQTGIYSQLEATEGLSERTIACRELINNIQFAIKRKVDQEKNDRASVSLDTVSGDNASTIKNEVA